MSESSSPSLRRPAAVSAALLVLGVVGLGVRQRAVYNAFQWDNYRLNVSLRAQEMARYAAEHKAWHFGPPQKPELIGVRVAWGYGVTTGLTVLLVGVLAFTLIAVGRRRLWLPVAMGGL